MSQSEQYCCGELIIEKTAFDITTFCNYCARIHGDDISGLDPKDYEAQFRRRFDPIFLPFLQKCEAAGYAVSENGVWHLTPKGFLVSNQIIGGLLDAQAAEKQRRADAAARGDFRVNLD